MKTVPCKVMLRIVNSPAAEIDAIRLIHEPGDVEWLGSLNGGYFAGYRYEGDPIADAEFYDAMDAGKTVGEYCREMSKKFPPELVDKKLSEVFRDRRDKPIIVNG